MSGQYDVVVVGARIAGSSTAMLLARAGLKVAVVERMARGTDTVSTHALMRAGVLQLSRWGLLPALRATGTPPVHRTLFHYPGSSVRVTIRRSPGVDALYAPRRTVIDPLLLDAAAEAGAHVVEQTDVLAVLRDGDRAAGVRLRGPDGAERDLRARMVIGADGVRSGLAAEVGAPVERAAQHAGAVLYTYRADLPTEGYEWTYGRAAAAGMIPSNDGLTCVFVSASPQDVRAARRAGVHEALRALFRRAAPDHTARLDESTPASGVHGWAGVPGFVRRSWGPGWALVGDAGYFRDPITTHGMTDALRDAELLSDAVVATLSGATSEEVSLAGYQRQRDALSRRLFEVTDRVASFQWTPDEIPALLRRVSSAMTDEVEFLESRQAQASSDDAIPSTLAPRKQRQG